MKKTIISIIVVLASLSAFTGAEAGCWTHFNGWGQRITNCGPGPGAWYGPGYYRGPYWGGPRVWVAPAPGVVVRFGGPYYGRPYYGGPGWGWRGRWY